MYLVANDADFIAHAKEGHCVAKAFPTCRELPVRAMGEPRHFDIDEAPGAAELRDAMAADEWQMLDVAWVEDAKDEAIANIDVADTCPACGFPALNSWDKCQVCQRQGSVKRS